MGNEKLDKIRKILKEEYDGRMTETEIDTFAKQLHHSLFTGLYELSDIVSTVIENETEADITNSGWDYIFCQMIELLDNGEETAKRLYDCFMHELDILNVFLKLYLENSEFLTEEQLSEVKKKALKTFDKEILGLYGLTE